MKFVMLAPLAFAVGVVGMTMTGPVAQAAPVSAGLSALEAAQPDLLIQVQRRRGGGRYVGRRGGRGWGPAVGAGVALGILGAAGAAAAASAPPPYYYRGRRCFYQTNPYTGEGYYGRC